MKKNIIISLVALSFSCFTWGQESKIADRRLNVEKNDQIKLVEKKEGKDQIHFSWPVINDTTNITSEKAIYVGKIEHNSGKKIKNFVVIENNKDTIINEESTNSTDSVLTIKPGNVYDFYKAGKVPFLTIKVVSPIPPTFNFAILSNGGLKIGGDTLSMGIDSSFAYKLHPDTLIYVNNWPEDYKLSLKGGILSSKVKNRLCCGDTVIIEKGNNKYLLLVETDELPILSGIPAWVTCSLAVLTLLLLFGLYMVIQKRCILQHSVELMSSDLAKAEAFLGQISEMLPIETLECENEQDSPVPQNSDEITNSENQDSFKQKDSNNTGDVKQQEASESGNNKQKNNKASLLKIVGLKLKKLFSSTEVYKEKAFLTEQISNGILVLNEKIQHNTEEIENLNDYINRINLLVTTDDEKEEKNLKEKLGEIGANIQGQKQHERDYFVILRKLKVDSCNDAIKEITDLQELNSIHSEIVEKPNNPEQNVDSEESDKTVAKTDTEIISVNNRSKVEELLKKDPNKLYNGENLEVAVIMLLQKFLDANYFRNCLKNRKDEKIQAALNRHILDTLGEQDNVLFPDAKGNSGNWITYLQEKFGGTKELNDEQKSEIIEKAILEAQMEDSSKSKILKEFANSLSQLLRYDSDREILSGGNFKIQTLADLLNSIPRSDEESREKGAEEILTLLQGALQSEEPISREDIYSAVRRYFVTSVSERIDEVLSLEKFKEKVSEKEKVAKKDGKEEVIRVLQSTFESISEEEGVAVEKLLNKIDESNLKQTVKKVFENWHDTINDNELEDGKNALLVNPAFEDVKADIAKYKSFSPLISKLTKIVEDSKQEAKLLAEKSQKLETDIQIQQQQHELALKDAEESKQAALNKQKEELDAKIQEEKDGRENDNREWQNINNANVSTIKEYHLAELTRIKNAMAVIDGQLRSAYTNFDRNTPLGKLIDSFIRKNTFYSLDKFLDKIENIETDPTESALKLAESMRTLYKECLNLTPPTWIDVLTRLYCYTDVPFIAEEFEKANLDCQSIRQAFFQMESLLRDKGIVIKYPRLFNNKVTSDYDMKPERNIDNYVSRLSEHVSDRQTIIDLYTVGYQIADEEPRKPVVSTF